MSSISGPVLILGARSDIGRALGRAYAQRGCDVILAARRAGELVDDKADLENRFGVKAFTAEFDVTDADPDRFFANLPVVPRTVVMVAGLLGDQAVSETDPAAAELVMRTNYTGPVQFLMAAARLLRKAGNGTIVGISSVAGDRGRASNYVYGSAKAGFTAALSGLRNSLSREGIGVLTVKPGFVATRMTEGMALPARLTAQPEAVASQIVRAQQAGRHVIYTKPIWRLIMAVIRAIPESVFRKLSL